MTHSSGLRGFLWATLAAGILLAFAWPAVLGADPADRAFEVAAKATLGAFLAALVAALVSRSRERR